MTNVKFILGMIVLGIVIMMALAYPMMLLWNAYIVPAIPVLDFVTWEQMFGILVFVRLLTTRAFASAWAEVNK